LTIYRAASLLAEALDRCAWYEAVHESAADVAGQSIRLRGKNLTETEHVKLGAYHTLELEPQRAFTLEKASWDALDIERIKQACDPAASADLAAVLIMVCC